MLIVPHEDRKIVFAAVRHRIHLHGAPSELAMRIHLSRRNHLIGHPARPRANRRAEPCCRRCHFVPESRSACISESTAPPHSPAAEFADRGARDTSDELCSWPLTKAASPPVWRESHSLVDPSPVRTALCPGTPRHHSPGGLIAVTVDSSRNTWNGRLGGRLSRRFSPPPAPRPTRSCDAGVPTVSETTSSTGPIHA